MVPDILVMNGKCVRILDACVVSTMVATVDHLHYPGKGAIAFCAQRGRMLCSFSGGGCGVKVASKLGYEG